MHADPSASPHDQHLIATFSTDSPVVRVLDVRQPGQALIELKGHAAAVNCAEWHPARRGILAAGGDDCEVLVWDVFAAASGSSTGGTSSGGTGKTNGGAGTTDKTGKPEAGEREPTSWWSNDVEVNNLSWGPKGGEWLGVVGGRGITGVAV